MVESRQEHDFAHAFFRHFATVFLGLVLYLKTMLIFLEWRWNHSAWLQAINVHPLKWKSSGSSFQTAIVLWLLVHWIENIYGLIIIEMNAFVVVVVIWRKSCATQEVQWNNENGFLTRRWRGPSKGFWLPLLWSSVMCSCLTLLRGLSKGGNDLFLRGM